MEKVLFLIATASVVVAIWVADKYGEKMAVDRERTRHSAPQSCDNPPINPPCDTQGKKHG